MSAPCVGGLEESVADGSVFDIINNRRTRDGAVVETVMKQRCLVAQFRELDVIHSKVIAVSSTLLVNQFDGGGGVRAAIPDSVELRPVAIPTGR